jgi:uncharacterized NAD(P)/FAD-binding protein YdhS
MSSGCTATTARIGNVDIAIIGCGAVGTAVLLRLSEKVSWHGSIAIVEPSPRIGPGLPYQRDLATSRLNRTAARMSVSIEEPLDFYNWACARVRTGPMSGASCSSDPSPDDFLPRTLFGDYLEERAEGACRTLGDKGWRVIRTRKSAIGVAAQGAGYSIRLSDNSVIRAAVVLLCTGHGPSRKFAHLHGPGFHDAPYPVSKFSSLPRSSRVGVIGSRLSAIDAVLGLDRMGHRGPIRLLSRTGLLPIVGHAQKPQPLSPRGLSMIEAAERGELSLRQIIRLYLHEMSTAEGRRLSASEIYGRTGGDPVAAFRQSLAEARSGTRQWQNAVAELLLATGTLWRSLPAPEQIRLQAAFSRIEAARVPIPIPSAQRVCDLLDEGRLTLAWPVEQIRRAGTGFAANTSETKWHDAATLEFDVLIDCSGAGDAKTQDTATLYRDMITGGLARPNRFGGIDVAPRDLRVINASGRPSAGLFALGSITRRLRRL